MSREVPFAISREERKRLGAALVFAREQASRSLERHAAAEHVAATVDALAARVLADDRLGAERELAEARRAVDEYRELVTTDDAVLLDLDVVTLVLDHAKHAAAHVPPAYPLPSGATDLPTV